MLRELIKPHHTISIIGTAKNAGKTTVLNQIISEYKQEQIAITSIGLDGEKIDNVTNKPKPRIKVYKHTLVATATDCLKDFSCSYVLYEKTNIKTGLGNIVIVEATSTGLVLLAGPSTKSDMVKLVHLLQKYNPLNIFIDGALFRKSLAATSLSDGLILSTGASYHNDIKTVVKDTKSVVDQFNIKPIKRFDNLLVDYNENFIIKKDKKVQYIGSLWSVNLDELIQKSIHSIHCLNLKGALTYNLINHIIKYRYQTEGFTIIVKDATHIICSIEQYQKLLKLNIEVKVLNESNLLALTYNPTSPYGYEFDEQDFYNLLQKNIKCNILNVLKEAE
jgi:hypothetical protein